jgi:hypothetical protein
VAVVSVLSGPIVRQNTVLRRVGEKKTANLGGNTVSETEASGADITGSITGKTLIR